MSVSYEDIRIVPTGQLAQELMEGTLEDSLISKDSDSTDRSPSEDIPYAQPHENAVVLSPEHQPPMDTINAKAPSTIAGEQNGEVSPEDVITATHAPSVYCTDHATGDRNDNPNVNGPDRQFEHPDRATQEEIEIMDAASIPINVRRSSRERKANRRYKSFMSSRCIGNPTLDVGNSSVRGPDKTADP